MLKDKTTGLLCSFGQLEAVIVRHLAFAWHSRLHRTSSLHYKVIGNHLVKSSSSIFNP